MRAILVILIALVVVVIAAVATGFVDINQIRGKAPQVTATGNGITAKGGEAPAFDVQTGSVKVGTGEANVTVPKITLGKESKQVRVPKLEVQPAGQPGNKSAQ